MLWGMYSGGLGLIVATIAFAACADRYQWGDWATTPILITGFIGVALFATSLVMREEEDK